MLRCRVHIRKATVPINGGGGRLVVETSTNYLGEAPRDEVRLVDRPHARVFDNSQAARGYIDEVSAWGLDLVVEIDAG
jgi:hypothetical protein